MFGSSLILFCIILIFNAAFASSHSKETFQRNRRRANSNGRAFYFDLGVNDGASVKSFFKLIFQEAKGPQNLATDGIEKMESNSLVNSVFADANAKKIKWNVVGFEVEIHHNNSLNNMRDQLMKKRFIESVDFQVGVAIGENDGTVQITLDNDKLGWGSAGTSLLNESRSAIGSTRNVPCVDIVRLLRERVTPKDIVFVKMDIEGKEYDLVQRLLDTGIMKSHIDFIAVEWHHTAFFVFGMPNANDIQIKGQKWYDDRVAIHRKYLNRYADIKKLIDSQGVSERFLTWG